MISHNNLIVLIVVCSFPFMQGVLLLKVSCFLMSKASLLELHSQSLTPESSTTYRIEKGNYYAVDYINNYCIGKALSAPDKKRNRDQVPVPNQKNKINVKRSEWPNHDDNDHVRSSCVFYGPLNLRGRGLYEIVDIDELEAIFTLVTQ